MNIIYKNDTLFVEIDENYNFFENNISKRIFSIIDYYDIDNVVINNNDYFSKKELDSFVNSNNKYKDKIKIK